MYQKFFSFFLNNFRAKRRGLGLGQIFDFKIDISCIVNAKWLDFIVEVCKSVWTI